MDEARGRGLSESLPLDGTPEERLAGKCGVYCVRASGARPEDQEMRVSSERGLTGPSAWVHRG